jgi:homoserine dehydrogenase
LPDFDEGFEKMKEDARKEGKVLRYVGVVDVLQGETRAGLERSKVFSFPRD